MKLFFFFFLPLFLLAHQIEPECTTKVVLKWNSTPIDTRKKIINKGLNENYKKNFLEKKMKVFPNMANFYMANNYSWFYFIFSKEKGLCYNKYKNTQVILNRLFGNLKNMPNYEIRKEHISKKELDYIKNSEMKKFNLNGVYYIKSDNSNITDKVDSMKITNCYTKVVLLWDKNVTNIDKELIIQDAILLNYRKIFLSKEQEKLSKLKDIATRNCFGWIYFNFGDNPNECENKYNLTKWILEKIFKPVKRMPKYYIVQKELSHKEIAWLKNTYNIYGEFRPIIRDKGNKVKYLPATCVKIPTWLRIEAQKKEGQVTTYYLY